MKKYMLVASLALLVSAVLQAAQPAARRAAQAGDISGVWYMFGGGGDSLVGTRDDDGTLIKSVFPGRPQSQWSAQQLPFTPAGRARFEANQPSKGPRAAKIEGGNDPLWESNPPGLYRVLVYSRPMELEQVPGKIIQLFGFDARYRVIYTDGRPVPDDVPEGPFWYGYSVGHWDGDTLVVTTLGLDGRAWMDEWGTPISDDARIEERWKRIAPNKLQLTIAVTDPEIYSRPWTSAPVVFTLKPKAEPHEVIFAPADEKFYQEAVRNPSISAPTK
jgi:hypothetical protein